MEEADSENEQRLGHRRDGGYAINVHLSDEEIDLKLLSSYWFGRVSERHVAKMVDLIAQWCDVDPDGARVTAGDGR